MASRWQPAAMAEAPALSARRCGPPRPGHVLLINPFYAKDPHASFGKHVLTPTLALTALAAATPAEWQVTLWDENLLAGPPPAEPIPQVVGISVHLTFAARAYELAGWYRARGALVVLGGLHVQSCPDEVAPHADAIAIGDGVELWPAILADAAAGVLRPRYEAQFTGNYAVQPEPRRDLLPRGAFLTTASVNATRGCHNRCGFCYLASDGLRMPFQKRDPASVAAAIRATGEPYAVFTDNNLGSQPDHLLELCTALRPLGIIWSAAVSLDVTDRPDVVRAMAAAGCTGVFVGFESLTDGNLAAARKRTPRAAEYAARVRLLHEHGIQVNASFVFGFDHDRPSVFAETAAWLEDNRIECGTFHLLTPYPGTPLFRQLQAEGRLLHTDWSRYDTAHCVFRPRHLSPAELEAGYAWIYRRIFSLPSIWRRRPIATAAVPAYLAMSLLYKRANPLWLLLIRTGLVHAAWRPLVGLSAWRHRRWRRIMASHSSAGAPLPASV